MAKVKLTKKDVNKIMKFKDQTRGAVLQTLGDYILDKKGSVGLEKVEKRLADLGYPLELKEISPYKWYEGPIDVLLTLIIIEVFNWDESKAFDIGHDSLVDYSPVAKLLLLHISIEKTIKNAPKVWYIFSHVGKLKVTNYNINKGFTTLRIEDYEKFHPALYEYLRGIFTKVIETTTKSKKVNVKQTKCLFWNDPYDEFKITW